ncbi:MAG TPA: sugar ABC transporter permease [Bacillota bacterium]|nr:sugar ABC transporter permease [Bacillota bacterium]
MPNKDPFAPSRARGKLRKCLGTYGVGLAFILPALLIYGIFQWYPILYNFILGFQNYTPGVPANWVGLRNFERVLSDSLLPKAILNTFAFTGWALLIGFLVPVIAAITITELRKGRSFFRLSIYMPTIIPAISLYIMWMFLFNPAVGLFNQILQLFHLPGLEWLLSPKTALVSLVIMSTWANFGGTALLYMASLSAVPEEQYEASEIDGAGVWQRIRYITIPSLLPTMLLLFLMQLLFTMQVLQEPFVMTGGGPNNATMTLMYMVYNYAFVYAEFGKAGALGILLFLFLLGLSLVYIKVNKTVQDEGR